MMLCPVLWLYVSTTKHDAGLHTDIHLPTCNARQLGRFSRQGLLYLLGTCYLLYLAVVFIVAVHCGTEMIAVELDGICGICCYLHHRHHHHLLYQYVSSGDTEMHPTRHSLINTAVTITSSNYVSSGDTEMYPTRHSLINTAVTIIIIIIITECHKQHLVQGLQGCSITITSSNYVSSSDTEMHPTRHSLINTAVTMTSSN